MADCGGAGSAVIAEAECVGQEQPDDMSAVVIEVSAVQNRDAALFRLHIQHVTSSCWTLSSSLGSKRASVAPDSARPSSRQPCRRYRRGRKTRSSHAAR